MSATRFQDVPSPYGRAYSDPLPESTSSTKTFSSFEDFDAEQADTADMRATSTTGLGVRRSGVGER